MYYRIIRNDILKSKLISLTTMIFVIAAAMLVSLAAILTVNLLGSIDTLMSKAKTPHFMQMHSGKIDTARLSAFAKHNGNVDEFQVLEFLNIDGPKIIINGSSFADNLQDNGLSTQSKKFDYLLDLDGKVIKVSDGEIYAPICYLKDGTAKVGDTAEICGKKFKIAGFLRDSQMNSTLSSSKRFLVSENDYAEIKNLGNIEYLIEFRLKDLSSIGAFETAYASADLEANGPAITYSLFKMINAISDGLMIVVILLVSMLVVAIAFMCIRFTLLAKIEDDYREIGVMKAIGLRISDIKKIYLAKYAAISAAGCILGFALSFVFRGMLLENIRLYMGESKNSSFSLLFGIIGILLVFLIIIAYVNRVLKRFRKISAAEAIRFGTTQEKSAGVKHLCLSKNKLLDTNIFLGIKDTLTRKRLYAIMFTVVVISVFIIIVPQNLYNTISSKSFVKYMGIGNCDILVNIQQVNDISRKTSKITKALNSDKSISKYTVLTTRKYTAIKDDGSEERIKVDLGDHLTFPVEYLKGKPPAANDEIALSVLNADELGKKTGDDITVVIGGKAKKLKVCGIYSDITNGGKTAKAAFNDSSAEIMWSTVYVELKNKSIVNEKVSEYSDRFDYIKIASIYDYNKQTFGSTVSSVKKASRTAIAVALIITVLITLLFMKMLVTKDRYPIAVMKAFGFTNSDIKIQYISRSVFVLIIGTVLGTLLANTLGEVLTGMAISSFGASSFKFSVNPISAYMLCPLMMICVVLAATIVGTFGIGQIKISENIKE
ncbi:MAG TPA: FtsX-like permease family protein [Clostridia bacterium]|nr:FtsX-like permease family protein [Clostridia bacterium]